MINNILAKIEAWLLMPIVDILIKYTSICRCQTNPCSCQNKR